MILLYMPFKKYNNKSRFKTKTQNLRKKNRRFRKSAKKQLGGGSLDDALIKINDALNILTGLQQKIRQQHSTQGATTIHAAKQLLPQQQLLPQRQQPPTSISSIDSNFYELVKNWEKLESKKQEPKDNYWTLGTYRGYTLAKIQYYINPNNNCESYFTYDIITRRHNEPTDFLYKDAESYLRPLEKKIKRPSCYAADSNERRIASNFFENLVLLPHYHNTNNKI